ncbi:MAG: hypothetical protein F8N37_12460 [Telmatospirillum sp.]|nr:hypothetical protein [Telmatospirillum sp.]
MFEAATLYFVFNQKAQRRAPVLRNVFMIDVVADMDVSARNGDASASGEKGWWSAPDAWVSGVRGGPPAGESSIPVKIVLSSGCPGCCSMRGGVPGGIAVGRIRSGYASLGADLEGASGSGEVVGDRLKNNYKYHSGIDRSCCPAQGGALIGSDLCRSAGGCSGA